MPDFSQEGSLPNSLAFSALDFLILLSGTRIGTPTGRLMLPPLDFLSFRPSSLARLVTLNRDPLAPNVDCVSWRDGMDVFMDLSVCFEFFGSFVILSGSVSVVLAGVVFVFRMREVVAFS